MRVLLLLGLSSSALASDLVFTVVDLEPGGQLMCTLHDNADTWLKSEGFVASVVTPVEAATTSCTFPDVADGDYAVSFIHDLDNSHDMDTNWFGMPKEPWGCSNDAPIRMGPPRFEDALVKHPGPIPVAHPR